jgi:hypothetical protein
VNFTDTTGVVLSARGTVVTYTDKMNRSSTMWLSEVANSEHSASIFSRLHYIKDMLNCLINKRAATDADDGKREQPFDQQQRLFGELK